MLCRYRSRLFSVSLPSWSKAVAVFGAGDEGLNHLSLDEVAVELIELCQPEVVAVKIKVRLRWIIRIATQISEVLHQDKGAVEFALREFAVLGDLAHHGGSTIG